MDWITIMASRAISLPFSFSASSGGVNYTEDLATIWKDRVVLVIMTKLNEKVMRPAFGSQASGIVFENLSDAMVAIKQAITSAFSRWLPDLTLVEVRGYEDKTDNLLTLEITYKYSTKNIETVNIKTALINRSGDIVLEVVNG
jgi:phage baseplate assembly protein W